MIPDQRVRAARVMCAALAAYALVAGALSLLGWVLDLPRLSDWDGDGIAIQPNAALLAACAGLALLFFLKRFRRASIGLGALVACVGIATLAQHATGLDFRIDRLLLFGRDWGTASTVSPGRMGPPASLAWTLAGAALVLRGSRREECATVAALGLLLVAISLFSLIGYLFGADPLYALPKLTAIALQTASIVLSVGLGLALSVPEREPMRTLFESSSAGALARRALPFVVLLPILFGGMLVEGHRSDVYDVPTGTALFVVLLIALMSVVLWWGVEAVRKREQAARQALASRDEINAALRVSEQQARTSLNCCQGARRLWSTVICVM